MGLDARGDISAAELAVYVPLLFISIVLVARHGFSRGWIYLLLLAISTSYLSEPLYLYPDVLTEIEVRIIGASTHIASELSTTPNTNLHIIYGIMESSGISPLLLSSLGFLGTVCVHLHHTLIFKSIFIVITASNMASRARGGCTYFAGS